MASIAFAPEAVTDSTISWTEVARATFDKSANGPGDGKSFDADVGSLVVRVPTDKKLPDIAPGAGISSGRLLLSDNGTQGQNDFGVSLLPVAPVEAGALISFDFTSKCEGNKFSVDVTNGATSDCSSGDVTNGATSDSCCPGDVTDGATTDMVSFDVDGGVFTVNGHAFKLRFTKGHVYRVDLGLYDENGNGKDNFDIVVTDVDTGASESWSDDLADDYVPVTAVNFVKRAGHTGDLSIDNLSLFAPSK